jgi:4-methylaminobutanoate oxidase (formaldehyde-forming)
LWGPKARTILQKVTQADISNEKFPYMTSQKVTIGDVPCIVSRVTYVGELGWEFYCPMEYGLRLWDTLWEAGQPEGMVAAGYKAIDTLRLEKAYRYWSSEITPDYTPLEAGLGFAVKFSKGDFLGKEALLKQKEEGVKQKLCCLTLEDSRTVAIGKEPIRSGSEIVGWVAAGGYGYSVGKSIVYAYLPVECAKVGTVLEIEFFGEQVKAEVAQMPLWDPKGERIRA